MDPDESQTGPHWVPGRPLMDPDGPQWIPDKPPDEPPTEPPRTTDGLLTEPQSNALFDLAFFKVKTSF